MKVSGDDLLEVGDVIEFDVVGVLPPGESASWATEKLAWEITNSSDPILKKIALESWYHDASFTENGVPYKIIVRFRATVIENPFPVAALVWSLAAAAAALAFWAAKPIVANVTKIVMGASVEETTSPNAGGASKGPLEGIGLAHLWLAAVALMAIQTFKT